MIFDVPDPDFERRIRTSFARQGLNTAIGATLGRVSAGGVEIEVPFSESVSQQHGFFHGGVMGAIGDSACGYAAMTLTPPGTEVLTIEYKVNFLSPGQGDRLVARGRVTKPGRTVTVCSGDVFAVSEGVERLVATMLVTMMTVGGPRDVPPTSGAAGAKGISTHRRSVSSRWCACRRLRTIKRGLGTVATLLASYGPTGLAALTSASRTSVSMSFSTVRGWRNVDV
jgi:uncharacterized protein (TIGR00369 family)